jgi:hypothetical protein
MERVKKHTPEQIVSPLRIEVAVANGKTTAQASKDALITERAMQAEGSRHRQRAHGASHPAGQGRTRPGCPVEPEAAGHLARVLALDEAEDLPFSGHGEQLAGGRASHHEGRLDCCDRGSEGCGDYQASFAAHVAA